MTSSVDIKICGISTPQALDRAIDCGASHVGFVHFPKSPRHLPLADIMGLAGRVPPSVTAVALLVNPDWPQLEALWNDRRIGTIQMHGGESPAQIAQFREQFAFRYWKAIGVSAARDLDLARPYAGIVDRVLFDAKAPTGSALPGGNGVRIDWAMLRGYRSASLPWGLAGGLSPENVAEAVAITGAPLVDVSSGVESAPGVKDMDKIAAFCEAVAAS